MLTRKLPALALAVSLVLLASCGYPLSSPPLAGSAPTTAAPALAQSFDKLPLYFVENRGQTDPRVAFYVPGRDQTLYFTPDGLTFAFTSALTPAVDALVPAARARDEALLGQAAQAPAPQAAQRWAVKLDFVGANPNVRPLGESKTDAVFSYFKGQQSQWRAGVPSFAQLRYPDLWPGVDLVYSGQANELKYEFAVRPGADPAQIQLAYRGASVVRLTPDGQLEVTTPLGGFRDGAPVAYQVKDGQRVPVEMSYQLSPPSGTGEGARYSYNFDLGPYDSSRPLVLDPAVLVYAGYIGGSGDDRVFSIAVDGAGNAYVTGYTTSSTFPVTVGPDLTFNGGGGDADAFVAKVNAAGTALVYAGYIGGAGLDAGAGIAVDGAGNAYVSGFTSSDQTSFPETGGPDLTYNGGTNGDAFVAKVNAAGTALAYAGYIGGTGDDYGSGIAVDGAGNAYITGRTNSDETSFPVTVGPDLTFNGAITSTDAFVAKVNTAGTALVYAGYIGGAINDTGFGIAVDGAGNAYVSGDTNSTDASFPVTGGPDQTYNGGVVYGGDAFVAKVNAAGTALVYAGYIGGVDADYGRGIAVDGIGNAYVTGFTYSTQATFTVMGGPDLTFNGLVDAFVVKVNLAGTGLVYAGYIGGANADPGWGIAVDGAGNAYITGWTQSTEATFPVTGGPDLTYNGGGLPDAFVAKVNAAGTALVYAGYIGGASHDEGRAITVDGAGNAYVTGNTQSDQTTFPVTGGPDLTFNGGGVAADAFVAKVSVPTVLNVDAYVKSPSLVGAPPAGVAAIPAQYGNNGATTATSVTLTATLGSGLTYLSDTSGFTPTVAGNTITWPLPNMSFMYTGQFILAVAVPNAPFGTRYPITLTLSSAGPEDNPSDNLVNLQVMIARQAFLPLINKGVQ